MVSTVNNEVWKLFFYRCDYGLDLVTYTYVLKVLMFLDQKVNFQPVFCSFLALFGIFSLSSFHVQSLRRTGAKSRAKRACTVMDGAPRASVRPSLSDAPAKLYAVSELACERGMGRRKAVERKQLHKWCPIAEQIGHHLPSPAFFRVLKGNKSNFLPLIFWREKFRFKNLLIFGSKIHVWDDFEWKFGNLNLEEFQVVRWRFDAFLGWKWVIFSKVRFFWYFRSTFR